MDIIRWKWISIESAHSRADIVFNNKEKLIESFPCSKIFHVSINLKVTNQSSKRRNRQNNKKILQKFHLKKKNVLIYLEWVKTWWEPGTFLFCSSFHLVRSGTVPCLLLALLVSSNLSEIR